MNLLEFVEWPAFTRRSEKRLTFYELLSVHRTLIENPEYGRLLKGTGGCRKMRVRRHNTGKRGGSRVIYYWISQMRQIHLIDVFAKNEIQDLTQEQRNELKKQIRLLKREIIRGPQR